MSQTLADFAAKIFSTDADLEGIQDYHMFIDTYDNSVISREEVKKDMSEIKVRSNTFFRRNGRKCLPFDYFTVHYRAFIDNNNTVLEYMDKVLDSRKKKNGRPLVFHGGQYEVVKCWDMAVPLMHAGEAITLECPAHFALGGQEKYSDFDPSIVIPSNTDLRYELEILECEANPTRFNQ